MKQQILRTAAVAIVIPALVLTGCGGKSEKAAPASATATAAASTYGRDANATLAALATSAAGVADVLAKPEPASAAWRSALDAKLEALARVDAQARSLQPGAGDAEVHRQLLDLTADFNRTAQLLRTGIEPFNGAALSEAAELLSASVAKVAVVRAALPQS